MFTSLPLAIPKKGTLIIILLAFFVIGCQPPTNQPPADTAVSSNRFTYQILVQENGNDQPIENANVTIYLPGTTPVNDFTNSTGLAVFRIDSQFANQLVSVHLTKDGYKDWEQDITLRIDEHPKEMKLQLDRSTISTVITETPTAVSSNTPSPLPTQEQTIDTAVPPTSTLPPPPTATPQPTNTPEPTATNTPVPSGQIIAQVTATSQDTWVYAGPGNANVRLGSMRLNETGIILGRDKWNGWYKVRTNDNIEGWVELSHLTVTQGHPDDVAVIWPSSDTSSASNSNETTELPSGGGSSGQCATVQLAFTEWPAETFDDITVSWTNVPANTSHFIFAANGTLNGEEAPLIYPTQVNVNEEYFIGMWKFTERGFTTGGTFSYALQAKSSNGTTICTTTGTFMQ